MTEFEKGRLYQQASIHLQKFRKDVGKPEWLLGIKISWNENYGPPRYILELCVDGDHPTANKEELRKVERVPAEKVTGDEIPVGSLEWITVRSYLGTPVKVRIMEERSQG